MVLFKPIKIPIKRLFLGRELSFHTSLETIKPVWYYVPFDGIMYTILIIILLLMKLPIFV